LINQSIQNFIQEVPATCKKTEPREEMFVYNDFKGIVEEQNLPPSMTLQEAITR
jgi:hypothetical protein